MTEAQVSANDISHLVELLERQVAVFEHLGGLADRQSALVTDGQAEALLTLLAQRQQLIDQLDAVTAELEPFRAHWSDLWTNLDPSGRQRIGPLVEQCERQLSQIMEADDRDRQRLQETQARIAAELGRVKQGTAARRAYGTSVAPNRNRFTNQEG